MPVGVINLEWLNSNSQRHYPITDDSSGVDTTTTFQLPDEFLLELDLPVHAGMNVDPSRFFIKQLGSYANGFMIGVGYQPASGDAIDVATALVQSATHAPGNSYALGGLNDYVDTFGKIVVGKLDNIQQQPAGLFQFTLTTSRIEPDCVRPIIRGLSSLAVSSGTEISDRMYGDIELVAGENIQLLPIIVAGQNPQIVISAINSDGLSASCVCVGNTTSPPIRKINGIAPSADGNFTFLGNACIDIKPIQNGLEFDDVCSTPCCGCQELDVVTAQLEQFGATATTLQGFVNRLQSEVTTMSLTVLGSRLNDDACLTCT